MITKIVRWLHAKARNASNKVTRPSAVTRAQHAHVKQFPSCAACGSKKSVQGHHVKPYHEFPDLAADPSNFISLCEAPTGLECHLRVGHGGHRGGFKRYNPDVVQDACDFALHPDRRDAIWAAVEAKALVDAPEGGAK